MKVLLAFKKIDIKKIKSEDPDFVEVRNQEGQIGLVPLNRLKVIDRSRRQLEEKRSAKPAREQGEEDDGEDMHEMGDDGEHHDHDPSELWSRTKDNLKKKVSDNN